MKAPSFPVGSFPSPPPPPPHSVQKHLLLETDIQGGVPAWPLLSALRQNDVWQGRPSAAASPKEPTSLYSTVPWKHWAFSNSFR